MTRINFHGACHSGLGMSRCRFLRHSHARTRVYACGRLAGGQGLARPESKHVRARDRTRCRWRERGGSTRWGRVVWVETRRGGGGCER
eukprot:2611244-Prymnesium_polylepis.1